MPSPARYGIVTAGDQIDGVLMWLAADPPVRAFMDDALRRADGDWERAIRWLWTRLAATRPEDAPDQWLLLREALAVVAAEATGMPPFSVLRLTERLALSLEGGLLRARGPIDFGDGSVLDAERAARIVLADVEYMVATLDDGPIGRAPHWESLEQQLERLCRVAPDEIVAAVETLRGRLEGPRPGRAGSRPSLDEILERLGRIRRDEHRTLLKGLVDAAIAITGADMGALQFLDPSTGSLRIVASRGFEAPFLAFFATVAADRSAGAATLRAGRPVIVEDVASSSIFTRAAHEMLLGAGVLAVQSIPLLSGSGHPIGVLSTHYRSAGMTGRRLDGVAALANRARGEPWPGASG